MMLVTSGASGSRRQTSRSLADAYASEERMMREYKRRCREENASLEPSCDEKPFDAFVCPITQELMYWPEMTHDGHSYESDAIGEWLAGSNSSPKTNLQLETKTLLPNHNLRAAINEWKCRASPQGRKARPSAGSQGLRGTKRQKIDKNAALERLDDEPPLQAFICPLTNTLMRKPVTICDGSSFESDAIDEWLADKNYSPKTKLRLQTKTLVPNHSLRGAIEEWHASKGKGASANGF